MATVSYSPSFLSVGIANDLSNCLAMLCLSAVRCHFFLFHALSIVSDPRNCRVHAAACHVPPSPNRRRPLQYSSFSPAVVLALLRLPFLRLPFLLLRLLLLSFFFCFFFFFCFLFYFVFLLRLLLLLLRLLLMLLRPCGSCLRPLPAAAAATAPGAAAAPGSKRKLTNSFSRSWKPLFLDLETLVLKP